MTTTGVVTTSFPRYPGDFAGCFVEDAVRTLVAGGDRVEVIAAGPRITEGAINIQDDERPDLEPAVRVHRVRVPVPHRRQGQSLFFGPGAPEVLESGGLASWTQAGLFWAGLCERLRARAGAWDRISAHWLVPSALAARAVAPSLALTAHAHSGDVALLERIPCGRTLARRLGRETDDLIFASADLRDRFTRLCGFVAGRVADSSPSVRLFADAAAGHDAEGVARQAARQLARRELGLGGRTVLSVGRLVPIKGFDVLLLALGRAAADRRASSTSTSASLATLVILGEGPERTRLERMAHAMDIDLRLPGCVPRAAVARWLSAADLYVQPSRRLPTGRTEGLPTATLEARNAGLPVIASRTGGLGELAGVHLVPPDDASALSAWLAELLTEPPQGV